MVYGQVKFVEVTGRSVIEDNSPLLSKNNALEDALYLAALEGGAKDKRDEILIDVDNGKIQDQSICKLELYQEYQEV